MNEKFHSDVVRLTHTHSWEATRRWRRDGSTRGHAGRATTRGSLWQLAAQRGRGVGEQLMRSVRLRQRILSCQQSLYNRHMVIKF